MHNNYYPVQLNVQAGIDVTVGYSTIVDFFPKPRKTSRIPPFCRVETPYLGREPVDRKVEKVLERSSKRKDCRGGPTQIMVGGIISHQATIYFQKDRVAWARPSGGTTLEGLHARSCNYYDSVVSCEILIGVVVK